jgi:endonuclease YncB( thermonuclease family)
VGIEYVGAGFAWWYRTYAREQPDEAREAYEAAVQEAQATKRGLWVDPHAVAPWEWGQLKEAR